MKGRKRLTEDERPVYKKCVCGHKINAEFPCPNCGRLGVFKIANERNIKP